MLLVPSKVLGRWEGAAAAPGSSISTLLSVLSGVDAPDPSLLPLAEPNPWDGTDPSENSPRVQ